MSDKSQTPLATPKIRTFAGDLAVERSRRNKDTHDEEGKEVKTTKPEPLEIKEKTQAKPKKAIPVPTIEKSKPKVDEHKKETESDKKGGEMESKKIPAFHELQNKINKIEDDSKKKTIKKVDPIKVSTKKPVEKSKKAEKPKKVNLGYEATIITDNKNNHHDFFPAIISSISEWFQKLLTPKPKATPKYTVADSSTRKGVIQKATTKSGSIFTADNESLKERIRKRQIEEANKVNADEPETIWSPYTETGYDLLDTPEDEEIEFTKKTDHTIPSVPVADNQPLPETEVTVVPEVNTTNHDRDLDEERWAGASTEPVEPQKKKEIINDAPKISNVQVEMVVSAPQVDNAPTDKPDSIENRPKNENEDKEEEPLEKKSQVSYGNKLEEVDTNTMSVLVLMVIIGIVSLFLVGRIVYNYINTSLENDVVVTRTEAVLNNSSLQNITLEAQNLNILPSLIDEARLNNQNEITEIAITDQAGNELSPSYIFDLLDFTMIPTMKQSISQVRFVSLNQGEEMILLQFTNEESVRGGFLNWEERMTNDLGPVLAEGITNNNFADKQITGRDTRQVISSTGQSITYLLLNNNTAIISSRTDDLERLINLEYNQ